MFWVLSFILSFEFQNLAQQHLMDNWHKWQVVIPFIPCLSVWISKLLFYQKIVPFFIYSVSSFRVSSFRVSSFDVWVSEFQVSLRVSSFRVSLWVSSFEFHLRHTCDTIGIHNDQISDSGLFYQNPLVDHIGVYSDTNKWPRFACQMSHKNAHNVGMRTWCDWTIRQ